MAGQKTTDADSDTKSEIDALKASYPGRCRVICDSNTMVTLQPENLDATIKFHLTAAYPSVIPDIKIRSESLNNSNIEEMEQRLKLKAQELMGKPMIQDLMEEAKKGFKTFGLRPGKTKNAKAETYIEDIKKRKGRKKQKSKSKSVEEEDEDVKKPSMKTAEDVVNRIIWDDNLDSDLFLVGYIDRFRGLLEKYFSAFSWEDISTVDYDVLAIPKHRIQYFKYKDVKVWDKTKRMDNVFGSANGSKTIDVVIKELEEQKLQQQNGDNNQAHARLRVSSDDETDDSDDDSDDDLITVTISSSVNIGTEKSIEEKMKFENTKEGNDLDPYWADKLRPNYFVCVRVTDKDIIENIGNVQDSILQHEPILGECCIPGASLHITISMLGLDTAEQLQQCMDVLKKMKHDLIKLIPKSKLKIEGVSNFYSRVIYGKVEYEKEFMEFCEYLKLNLRESGVQIRDGYEFVPHVTILKVTRPVSRARRSKDINPNYYDKFSNLYFGEQEFDTLYLCSVGDQRRPDGFYLTPLELKLVE